MTRHTLKATIRHSMVALGILLSASGCATAPYTHVSPASLQRITPLRDGEFQIERGKPNRFVDAVGTVFSIPSKIVLWNMYIDSHKISDRTEKALVAYLTDNGLTNVKVRINQYAPGAEFQRLVRNKRVGFGWRYTLGLISWAFYTVLPQRIFGGDNYNPWSDTISIYSDHPAVAIHEGGHAKDFAARDYPGTYGFFYMLPFAALYPEAKASTDALSYFRSQCNTNDWKAGYKVLYPAYGTYIGGNIGQYILPYTWVYFAAVIPGHALGRIKASKDLPCPSEDMYSHSAQTSSGTVMPPPNSNATTAAVAPKSNTIQPQTKVMSPGKDVPTQLIELKELKDAGILTDEEYETRRKALVGKL